MKLNFNDYEWEVQAAGLSTTQLNMIALSIETDPFAMNQDRQIAWAMWFQKWFQLLAPEAAADRSYHLRRIHYLLVSQREPVAMPGSCEQGYQESLVWIVPSKGSKKAGQRAGDTRPNDYRNDQYSWIMLCSAAKWARTHELVNAELIDDHRSPKPYLSSIAGISSLPQLRLEQPRWWLLRNPFVELGDIPELPGLEDLQAPAR